MPEFDFELLHRYAHVGLVVSTCDCLEAAELAVAADHLLIGSMQPICMELIRSTLTVDKVWTVLDLLHKFNLTRVATSCQKVFLIFFIHALQKISQLFLSSV